MSIKSILCIGDIIGLNGRTSLTNHLDEIKKEFDVDFVIGNGENIASGIGVTRNTSKEMFDIGIDVLTSGNHIWHNKDVFALIGHEQRLLRPHNYPDGTIGLGYNVYTMYDGVKIGIVNVLGRIFMEALDCPFRKSMSAVNHMKERAKIIVVDMHAEASAEKVALGYYLNGHASVVFGTHTHVQTADEKILSDGTAYITDVGMCGGYDSVIGMKKDGALSKFITHLPNRFEVSFTTPMINAIVVAVDDTNGKALSIRRINRTYPNDKIEDSKN